MSSAGSLKTAAQCWARGKSWGSGTALEIISLISVSCGFSFLQKQSCLKIKALKYPGRDECVATLYFNSPHGWLLYNANRVGP